MDIETSNQIDDEKNKLAEVHASRFSQLSEIEGIIIRGHILVEHELNNAIANTILYKKEFNYEKFSFSQKVLIGNMLGVCNALKDEISALNKLRNQIAHRLEYEEKYIEVLISGISKRYLEIKTYKTKYAQMQAQFHLFAGQYLPLLK